MFQSFLNIETAEMPIVFLLGVNKRGHLSAFERWRVLSNYIGMMCTVLSHCPISAEISTVDSQSDLGILL